jgi:hypothetical protein
MKRKTTEKIWRVFAVFMIIATLLWLVGPIGTQL